MSRNTASRCITAAGALFVAMSTVVTVQEPSYQVVPWNPLPAAMEWGETPGMSIDANGHVFAFHRLEPPILEFDPSGTFVRAFGEKQFVWPHGFRVDRDGFFWATDGRAADGKGMQVFKMTRDGHVVLRLGQAGVMGDGPDAFGGPNDVAIAVNGDIFVADGHTPKTGTARIMKFDKTGRFLKQWGGHGSLPGQFEVPHSIAFDSRGRLFVADRSNDRIQIFDQDGRFLEQWAQFGGPSGLFIAPDDTLYATDGFGNGPKTGTYIGSAKDGTVKTYLTQTKAECVVADRAGTIYAGETSGHVIKRLIKK